MNYRTHNSAINDWLQRIDRAIRHQGVRELMRIAIQTPNNAERIAIYYAQIARCEHVAETASRATRGMALLRRFAITSQRIQPGTRRNAPGYYPCTLRGLNNERNHALNC